MANTLAVKDYEKLRTNLEVLDGQVLDVVDTLKALQTKFQGTLAEACILTKSAREVLEINVLARVQLARVLKELNGLDEYLRMMVIALMCEVKDG